MNEAAIAVVVFLVLLLAAIGAIHISKRMPAHYRSDETAKVVSGVASIFVMLTSIAFGLMINSAKNTYAGIDSNVHAFATDLIILDRMLRTYGPAGADARVRLVAYMEEAIAHPARADPTDNKQDTAGAALDALGSALAAIQPPDRFHEALLLDMRQQYRSLVDQRWTIIEQSEGAIPSLLIWMLIAWMVLVFGSFGYRAPNNAVVITSFVTAALLIAVAFYLVLDMDVPFHGPIQISDAPFHRALAEMKL